MLRYEPKVPMLEPGLITRVQPLPTLPTLPPLSSTTREQNLIRTIERVILEEYAPASVIINEQGEVIYFSGHTGKFLEPAVGAPSNKIINLARRSLRLELRTALHRALTTHQEVIRRNISVKTNGHAETINLIVRPLVELGRDAGLYVVIFQELVSAGKQASKKKAVDTDSPLLRQLENELRTTKEDLQSTIEELETSNEELKSANEELLSMNEELQSTNEELQTSKEELQSLNDELQRKIEELDAAHADLANLFQGTQLATLFLDPQLRIKKFTPAMNQVIRLTERDLGRHFLDAAPDLDQPEIASDIEDVLNEIFLKKQHLSI